MGTPPLLVHMRGPASNAEREDLLAKLLPAVPDLQGQPAHPLRPFGAAGRVNPLHQQHVRDDLRGRGRGHGRGGRLPTAGR
jgi:hypothetical protein